MNRESDFREPACTFPATRICPRCGFATMRPGPTMWECGRVLDCGYKANEVVATTSEYQAAMAREAGEVVPDRAPAPAAPAPVDDPQAAYQRVLAAWIDARAVVRAARDVVAAWHVDNHLSKPGTSIGYLRDAVTKYDQRHHDRTPPAAAPVEVTKLLREAMGFVDITVNGETQSQKLIDWGYALSARLAAALAAAGRAT